MPYIVNNAQCEESEDDKQGNDDADYHDLHRNVPLSSDDLRFRVALLPAEFACSKAKGRFDHSE